MPHPERCSSQIQSLWSDQSSAIPNMVSMLVGHLSQASSEYLVNEHLGTEHLPKVGKQAGQIIVTVVGGDIVHKEVAAGRTAAIL